MKEITVIGYCDYDHDERTRSAVERVLSVDGSKPVAIDLCDDHDRLVQQMLDMMERGVVVKAPSKKKAAATPQAQPQRQQTPRPSGAGTYHEPTGKVPPLEGPHICPECGFESVSRGALGQHLTTTHDKGFRDYNAA